MVEAPVGAASSGFGARGSQFLGQGRFSMVEAPDGAASSRFAYTLKHHAEITC